MLVLSVSDSDVEESLLVDVVVLEPAMTVMDVSVVDELVVETGGVPLDDETVVDLLV